MGKILAESESSVASSDYKSDEQYRTRLTSEEYRVARQAGTEMAFTGRYWNTKTPGLYQCVCCEQPLFNANTKYDSGTGWPSFYAPVTTTAVTVKEDNSLGVSRTEALCSRCDAHLGHVFADGPAPTGDRFCMNSLSLKLIPEE